MLRPCRVIELRKKSLRSQNHRGLPRVLATRESVSQAVVARRLGYPQASQATKGRRPRVISIRPDGCDATVMRTGYRASGSNRDPCIYQRQPAQAETVVNLESGFFSSINVSSFWNRRERTATERWPASCGVCAG